jgi:D-alanine-D-alanine ligase
MDESRIVVLFGGSSGERRVSVASAQHVVEVLAGADAWFVAPNGAVYTRVNAALREHARPFEADFQPSGDAAFPSLEGALDAAIARDKAFLLGFHGGAGEDGTVQRMLEARMLPFTGSGSVASARAFDKRVAKEIVAQAGVPVADAVLIEPANERAVESTLRELFEKHGRVVAKPVADGSSVGLFHVQTTKDLESTARAIAKSGLTYLAEQFVAGTELTIGVVDMGEGPRALCASEVRLAPGRAFDFEGKYLGKGTVEVTPADVPADVAEAAMKVALAAHRALGCEGYSRTDVISSKYGPVFLETNTLPGLTKASFIPQQIAVAHISMRAFLERQVEIALVRRER